MNLIKWSAVILCLLFSVYGVISPADSWHEAVLKVQIKLHQFSLAITSNRTEYDIARIQADLYQQLQPQTPAQQKRQLDAQLAAADLAELAAERTIYLQQASILEQQMNPTFAKNAPLLLTRAKVHLEQKQPQFALPLLAQSIKLFNNSTEEQLLKGQSLNLLCQLKLEQGSRQVEANVCEEFYQWTQQSGLASTEQQSAAMHNLAMLRLWSGQLEQAKELFTGAIAFRRQLGTHSALALVNSLQGYAAACNDLSLFELAETALFEAFHILEHHPSNTVTQQIQLLHNTAENQTAQGKYEQAFQYAEKALQMLNSNPQKDLLQQGALQNQLGSLAQDLARHETALNYYLLALQSFQSLYSSDHPYTASVLNNLGSVYRALNNPAKAKDYYLEALAMRRAVYGTEHFEVIATENNLALNYEDLGQIDEATSLLEQSLAKMQTAPNLHPNISVIAVNLGRIYIKQNDPRAESLLKTALQDQQKRLGSQHPDLLPTLYGLARYYRNQKKFMDAEQLYLRALRIAETALPAFHPDIAALLFQLGRVYHLTGDYVKAEQFYRKELAILDNNKNDADGRKATLKHLKQLLQATGRASEAKQLTSQ